MMLRSKGRQHEMLQTKCAGICLASKLAEQISTHSAYDSEAVMAFDLYIILLDLNIYITFPHIRSRDWPETRTYFCPTRILRSCRL